MSASPNNRRSFTCNYCNKAIFIPLDLPPTEAPCPHCGQQVTSPPLPSPQEMAKIKEEKRFEELRESSRTKSPMGWVVPVGTVVCLLALGVGLLIAKFAGHDSAKPGDPSLSGSRNSAANVRPADNSKSLTWQKEAIEVLRSFVTAATVDERAAFVLDGSGKVTEMEQFYQKHPFREDDSPLDAFTPIPMQKEDSERGLYLLVYDRPAQFEIEDFFRPIVPLGVKYGLEKPDLILQVNADLQNFVDEALRVMAFFKETDQGLKLDWPTYAQTKYRLLEDFVENPTPGREEDFRVVISEDVDGREQPGESVYRLADPANLESHAKVVISDASELGQLLAPLKWRGKVINGFPVRNATVRLAWSDDAEPSLKLSGLICWEFLGLGGEPGNWQKDDGE